MENNKDNNKENNDNEKNFKNYIIVGITALLIYGMFIFCLVNPQKDYSDTERRRLAKAPDFSISSILEKENSFMNKFEDYTVDQFPLRENFRKVNAVFKSDILFMQSQNEIFSMGKYTSKLDYEINQENIEWTLGRFQYINDNYLKNSKVYISVIPDKNYYLIGDSGYPAMNYDKFFEIIKNGTDSYAAYIDLTKQLSIENYYYTDTHWKQETILRVADYLSDGMNANDGVNANDELSANDEEAYSINKIDKQFYGVYCGQAARDIGSDEIKYLTSDEINNCKVKCFDYGTEETMKMYDLAAAEGRDGYELFLSGSKALITIDNPAAKYNKELIIFRDSFGSSLAPLLTKYYKRITLVDIRYISPAFLGNYIKFDGKDVLFLYSIMVINGGSVK